LTWSSTSEIRKKGFDTSGKSGAYLHRRKNFKARAGKSVRGLFESNGDLSTDPAQE
jgi:hypothetical protein